MQVEVPTFYKELRKIQIKTNFQRSSPTTVSCAGSTFLLETVKSRDLYRAIVSRRYMDSTNLMVNRWVDCLGCSPLTVRNSWRTVKVKFENTFSRTFHYRLLYGALTTNSQASHFSASPNYCTYCFEKSGERYREDLKHIFIYCPRAYDLYYDLSPILCRISGKSFIGMDHLFFGLFCRNVTRNAGVLCFNLLVHTMQRSIWKSKGAFDGGARDFDIQDFFNRIIYFDIAKAKTILSDDNFWMTFGGPNGLAIPKIQNSGFALTNIFREVVPE